MVFHVFFWCFQCLPNGIHIPYRLWLYLIINSLLSFIELLGGSWLRPTMITGKHLLLQTIAATQQRKHWPSWHRKNLRPSHCSKWCLFILYSTIEQSTQQSCKQNILIFLMLGFKDLNKCTTSVICFFLEECLQELKNTPCFFNLYWGTFVK